MYALKNYGSMRHKEWMFKRDEVFRPPTEDIYSGWRNVLEGSEATYWRSITARFDEYFQYSVLRAVTVAGISTDSWSGVFRRIAEEFQPFQDVTRLYMQGVFDADWRFFAEKVADDLSFSNRYFPCVRPEWLFPYGFGQQYYLADLALYWDNLHEGYKTSWNIVPIHHDSPEIVHMKRLTQAACFEIDQVARHSEQYLKRLGGQ